MVNNNVLMLRGVLVYSTEILMRHLLSIRILSYILTTEKNVIYVNSVLWFYKKDLEDLKNKNISHCILQ